MPRTCSICKHKSRTQIELMLINSESLRSISKRFSVSVAALSRHKENHLPEKLSKSKEAQEIEQADQIMVEIDRCLKRINLLFDSCHEWLTDPEDPEKYSINPRSDDIDIIYLEPGTDEMPIRKKAKMSYLLHSIHEKGYQIISWEYKSADPRELILKTAGRLGDLIEILVKLKITTEQEKRIAELESQIESNNKGGGQKWGA